MFDSYCIPMTPDSYKIQYTINNQEEAVKLIQKYLAEFGLVHTDLSKTHNKSNQVVRLMNGISLSEIRRVLCYYFHQNTPFTLKTIAMLVSFKEEHTKVIHHYKTADHLLKNKDEKFLYYWNVLIRCAEGKD